jgi:hypothetical protein
VVNWYSYVLSSTFSHASVRWLPQKPLPNGKIICALA